MNLYNANSQLKCIVANDVIIAIGQNPNQLSECVVLVNNQNGIHTKNIDKLFVLGESRKVLGWAKTSKQRWFIERVKNLS